MGGHARGCLVKSYCVDAYNGFCFSWFASFLILTVSSATCYVVAGDIMWESEFIIMGCDS